MQSLTITVFGRLHISLIEMSESGYRINGGAGFALEDPSATISIYRTDEFIIKDYRAFPLTINSIDRLKYIINNEVKILNFKSNIGISITGNLPSNFGFGSGTSIRLACLEALYILNNHSYTELDLIKASGRGGTSGIGINAYFRGGFIIDIGHKRKNAILLPSSAVEAETSTPLNLVQCHMPKFSIGLCIPYKISRLSQNDEIKFFKRITPIDVLEVHKTLYHIIYGLYTSVKENDLNIFATSINNIQKCFWKASEIKLYGNSIQSIFNVLTENGINGVGMSSLGPSLYFVATDFDITIKKIQQNQDLRGCEFIKTKPRNSGRTIHYA